MGWFSDSKKDGMKDGEKGRIDPIREFFDGDYRKGVDAGKGIRGGEKARRELDKHPIAGPIVDALGGDGLDKLGKSKDFCRTYDKVKRGESPRKVFSDEIRNSRKGDVTSPRERSEPYFWGRDDDRSYTTRDKYSDHPSTPSEGIVPKLVGWFIGLWIVGLLSIGVASSIPLIVNSIRKLYENKTPIYRTIEGKVVPVVGDYSVSRDEFQIIFSRQLEYAQNSLFKSKSLRSRIFLKDLHTNLEKMIGIWEIDGQDPISWEDFVAPSFSPDGKKIAFAVTRGDHPTAIYVMNDQGTNIRRVSEWAETIVFGWASNENLFIWTHYDDNADFFDPLTYKAGESSLVNIDNPNLRHGIDFNPRKKSFYIPSGPLKIKYVSSRSYTNTNGIKGYIIEENRKR